MRLYAHTISLIFLFLLLGFSGSGKLFAQQNAIDSLKFVLSKSKKDSHYVMTLRRLSREYKVLAQFDSAFKYIHESLKLARQLNYKHGEADGYRNLGLINVRTNDLDEARINILKAIKLREEAGEGSYTDEWLEDRTIAALYLDISGIYYIEDNYPEAINYTLKALALYEKKNNKPGMARAYQSLGGIYFDYVDYKTSLTYLNLALKYFSELKLEAEVAVILCGLGHVENEMGNNNIALEHIMAGKEIYTRLNQESGIATADSYLGKTYLDIGKNQRAESKIEAAMANFKLAEAYCLKGQLYFDKTEEYIAQAYNYYFLGEIYMNLGNFSKSKLYLEKAKNLSLSTKNKYTAKLSFLALSALDSTQGNYRAALENYKKYFIYRDSIANNDNTAKLKSSKLQYEFDKKEDSLKQKQLLTQVKLNAQKNEKYFYLAGLILAGLLFFFVFRNFRHQKKISRLANEAHSREKAELELQSLRAQLNPHFMFNSLNAIQELILMEENEKSQSYLARFAKLLRMLLENAERPFIPLQRELDFLKLYLSLENLRIPDLEYYIDVDPSINTEQTIMPNMILQPYIENAIWHGLSHKTKDKKLEIRISKSNGSILYEIEDNGVGRKKATEMKSLFRKEHKSKGMELLSKRFKLLSREYGSDIKTEFTDVMYQNEVAGTLVTIKVPGTLSKEIKNTTA